MLHIWCEYGNDDPNTHLLILVEDTCQEKDRVAMTKDFWMRNVALSPAIAITIAIVYLGSLFQIINKYYVSHI